MDTRTPQFKPDPEIRRSAAQWLNGLETFSGEWKNALCRVYGSRPEVVQSRLNLLRRVLEKFIDRFGDGPIRVFRSPGRINLRGMHVDTHGGYLNLMTHQREMVLAVRSHGEDMCQIANIDPEFADVSFRIEGLMRPQAFQSDWMAYISSRDIVSIVQEDKGRWDNYLKGAAARAAYAVPGVSLKGFSGVVGSDLPRGAALSSSHALCLVTLMGMLATNGFSLSPEQLILAIRDAEWFTGARTGTSDQAAEILGGKGTLVNAALLPEDLDMSHVRRIDFPDDLDVLVLNSYTRRNLSGAQLAAYTTNRFSYSMALHIVRKELESMGYEAADVSRMDRLSRLTPESLGGLDRLYALLLRIPERASLEEVQQRYSPQDFETAYERYFGNVPEAHRPVEIGLRGPLTFGIAESERARHFISLLHSGDYAMAGRLMSVGHDGDRIVDSAGIRFSDALTDGRLRQLACAQTPIMLVPGDYGASSPVLDGLVDQALSAGALGASLTGAGLAGAVLALCRRQDTHCIAERLREWFDRPSYCALARRSSPLSAADREDAVLVNYASAGAGELLPG